MTPALIPSARSPDQPDRKFRIPVALALIGGVSLLTFIAVGGVLLISFLSTRANTLELLQDRADLGLELLETRIRSQLDPITDVGNGLAALISAGDVDPMNPNLVRAAFQGALTAVPQATAIIYVGTDHQSARVSRGEDPLLEVVETGISIVGMGGMTETMEGVAAMLEGASQMDAGAWLPPLWVQTMAQPVLNLEVPVRRDGAFIGALFVVVELGSLVDFLARLEEQESASAFVLYGPDHILAHPHLLDMMLDINGGEVPLPEIASFADPALSMLGAGMESIIEPDDGDNRMFTSLDIGGEYILMFREIIGYGAQPWRIGLTFPAAEISKQLDHLRTISILGLGILGIAVVLGWWVGHSITRQISALAVAARKLSTLDIANTQALPDSRFKELAAASQAFNAMTAGLRWFETYVPKSLVLRLMQRSDEDVTASSERTLTVMFTDIRGFSTMAEHMDASAIANLLNHHFELLSGCIEAQGGTVDKFIGDSVMAFWGAPEYVSDHAVLGIRAAQAIQRAVTLDNIRRKANGEPPILVRVGLHTGPVVVGNIGSMSRVNYTVVGDTVNAASRLESLGKEIDIYADDRAEDCIVLFSDATLDSQTTDVPMRSLGSHKLRGRSVEVEVYQLISGPEDPGPR